MKKRKKEGEQMKAVLVTTLVLVLLGLMLGPSDAQMDVAKALVGTWEGQIQRASDNLNTGRTLIIGQVRQQEGKWIVEGAKYGITGRSLDPVEVTLEEIDGVSTIQFRTPASTRNPVKLRLTKEGVLVGTITLAGASTPLRTMELKKGQ